MSFPQAARRPAYFVHPGTPTWPRLIDSESMPRGAELRIVVPAHANVGAALRQALSPRGTVSGCGRVAAGSLSSLQYHVIVATAGDAPFGYGSPIKCDGELTLVTAAVTLGRKPDGAQILHCHGGFIDAAGKQHGGHIALDACVAGLDGLVVRVCLFDDIEYVISPDDETRFDLLTPVHRN
ncbi:hypothetical protein OVY01_17535 [Robbsia sp. Bb-Pol-6]|uniref:PPC domain-containing protein n=1 Tax=Robbsia betulipollinis TaxID=2981849 RepID=A0ABT3ZR10_9BURK|nr:hypothetical protein [Robbsia betulipollinis]MCY0388975.1 hypothetical protein [Robbsia betulipollinis]